MSAPVQDRVTKLEALLERVRARGTRDDSAPSMTTAATTTATTAPAGVAAAAAVPARNPAPTPVPLSSAVPAPVPAATPARPAADAAPISSIPEITVGGAREFVREVREDGRRISNVPASVRGSTDRELPSVIIAPAPVSAPISSPPISSVELEADDVIEAEPAPLRSLSRLPPPPPPTRSPTIPPPSTMVTPIPVASAPPPAAPAAAPDTVQLSVPTPATGTPIPVTRQPQPHFVQARQSENRLGDADITAGHPVSVDVDLDEVAPPEEQPAPSSSRRPRSEHAELGAALEEDEARPPHTVPPESGRQASVSPAESGKRSSVPAVTPDSAPPPSLRPDIATGRQPEAQVASFEGVAAVTRPATFGELLDNALSL